MLTFLWGCGAFVTLSLLSGLAFVYRKQIFGSEDDAPWPVAIMMVLVLGPFLWPAMLAVIFGWYLWPLLERAVAIRAALTAR